MKRFMKAAAGAVALATCIAMAAAQDAGPRQGRRGFGPGGGGGGNELALLMRADVQRDLKLTDEQKKGLDSLREKMRAERGQGGQRGAGAPGGQGGQRPTEEEMQRMREEARARREALRKEVAAILDANQMKRLGEISIQLRGVRAILDPEVQTALGLTQEQIDRVRTLMRDQGQANRTLMEKARNGELTREQVAESRQNNERILETELAKVLTPEQAAKLKDLGGAPFQADPEENRRRQRPPGR